MNRLSERNKYDKLNVADVFFFSYFLSRVDLQMMAIATASTTAAAPPYIPVEACRMKRVESLIYNHFDSMISKHTHSGNALDAVRSGQSVSQAASRESKDP